jgi:predicted transcriptional regulator
MLEYLLGSRNKERILLFILNRKEGYAREIATYYDTDISPIQNQLDKMEIGNILYSRTVGRTRVYAFNPRYQFLK